MNENLVRTAWEDQQRILQGCLDRARDYTPLRLERGEHLLAHFEQTAETFADRLALKKGEVEVNYRELNRRANGIARALLAQRGPGKEAVALLFGSSPEGIAAMLGVLKAGKFFVALDTAAPPERAAFVLQESGATTLLTDEEHLAAAHNLARDMPGLTVLDAGAIDEDTASPGIEPHHDALVTLAYTSGSSGRPKGVMLDYPYLLHRTANIVRTTQMSRHDCVLLLKSSAFLGSFGMSVAALMAGACVRLFDVGAHTLGDLRRLLHAEPITILPPPHTLFRQLAATLEPGESFPALRHLRLTGELTRWEDIALFQEKFAEGCVFRSGYAGTETAMVADFFADHATRVASGPAPCGYPSLDSEVRIVDEHGEPVGPNEEGEVVVRSRYLARGYWRQPELTAERILPDPEGGDARLFRTGDLGRILPDGMLLVAGRVDSQVKVRGYRVETSEVEAALTQHPAVQAAVVLPRSDRTGGSRLVGYVAHGENRPPSIAELRQTAAARLPAYMIPQRFVLMGALPLIANGKVNLQALPEPSSQRPDLETPYLAPVGPLEQAIAAIWQDALQLDRVGNHDPFLQLGGDSLLALQIVTRVQERVGADLALDGLMAAGTVAEMAACVRRSLTRQVEGGELNELIAWAAATG